MDFQSLPLGFFLNLVDFLLKEFFGGKCLNGKFFLRFCLFGLEIFVIVEGKLRHFNFLAEKTWLQFYLGSCKN